MSRSIRAIILALTIAGLAAPAASYANGHVLTQSLDARQKPYVLKTVKSSAPATNAVWLTHGYNTRGRLSSSTDAVLPGENRSFTYDKKGRLVGLDGAALDGLSKTLLAPADDRPRMKPPAE